MIHLLFPTRRLYLGDRAIEQSKIKHIVNIGVALANQLKSGDPSIKTTNIEEAEALKQFADHAVIASEASGNTLHVWHYPHPFLSSADTQITNGLQSVQFPHHTPSPPRPPQVLIHLPLCASASRHRAGAILNAVRLTQLEHVLIAASPSV